MSKVYSFDNYLHEATGAQRVMIDIHNAIKSVVNAKIVGTIDYNKLNPSLGITSNEYMKLSSIFMLKNSVVIVHQRHIAVKLNILNKILFLGMRIVYVHHNILTGMQKMTMLPQYIITISDKCIDNLTTYFKISRNRITKIYNGVPDTYEEVQKHIDKNIIKILYPATIYPVKQQIEIVNNLKKNLSKDVKIYFAGKGEQYNELVELIKDDLRFKCLGFVNVKETLKEMDYCMLYSKFEGLPISLIEGCMMGKPIICNDVGGNIEIVKDGYNGFVCNSWIELLNTLNKLPKTNSLEYINLSKNSRNHYLNNFTYEEFKSKYIEYILRLI